MMQLPVHIMNVDETHLFQDWCGLHSSRSAGDDVAADDDVGLHQRVPVLSHGGHQVGEGGELSLGDGGQVSSLQNYLIHLSNILYWPDGRTRVTRKQWQRPLQPYY